MPLPECNEFGDLPEGNHPASLAEVVARFGSGTAQRAAVSDRLRRIYQLAVATGYLDRVVVFGSYSPRGRELRIEDPPETGG